MKYSKKMCLLAGAVLIACGLISGCGSNGEQPTTIPVTTTPATIVPTTVPMESETKQQSDLPWDNGGKQPIEYTWEEFEALSGEQQIAFQNAMGQDAFEEWMSGPMAYPWDEPGAKQPEEYTWEEFEMLSAEHQIEFQNILGLEAFEAWLDQAQNQIAANPWDEPGAKQPEEYTWEEFEALSVEHQIEFQFAMGFEEFEAWMSRVNP